MSRGPRVHRAQVETHLAEMRAQPKNALRDAAGRRRAVSPAGVAAVASGDRLVGTLAGHDLFAVNVK